MENPNKKNHHLPAVPGRHPAQKPSSVKVFDRTEQAGHNSTSGGDSKVFSWAVFGELAIEFAVLIGAPLILFIFLGPLLKLVGLTAQGEYIEYQRLNNKTYTVTGLFIVLFLSFYGIIKKIRHIEQLLRKK